MHTPYRYPYFIPFHLADPAGILFFGHVFTLVHQAFEHFVLHQLKYSWNEWFQHPEWIVPICHAEAQYRQPIRAGQECLIEIVVSDISHSSFTLTSTLYQSSLCCSVKTVHVFCHRISQQKLAIPSQLRTLLQQIASNTICGK